MTETNVGCSICRDWATITKDKPASALAAFPCDNCGSNLCEVWLQVHPDRSPTPAVIVPSKLAWKIADQIEAALEGGHKITGDVLLWAREVLLKVKP